MSDTGWRKSFYAFVEGSSEPTPEESSYARLGLTLDCVSAEAFHDEGGFVDENLVIVRVLSTGRRLKERFRLQRIPQEGDWFLIELAVEPGLPVAWTLSAVDDYQGLPIRTNLVGLWFIDPDGLTPRELKPDDRGRAKLLSTVTGQSLSRFYYPIQPIRGEDLFKFVALFAQADTGGTPNARVLDVGQASCVALYTAPDPAADVVGFFDVGAPIWFHERSMPKSFDIKLPAKNGFVILSHWDFDHYAMAWWRKKELRELNWFAPIQVVGANGARFQKQLGARLHYIDDDQVGVDPLSLIKGTGAAHGLTTDRNATGYVLRLADKDGVRLLTGDVDYGYVPMSAMEQLVGLTIPHHGGTGAGVPPTPDKNNAPAVASYGTPNRYRHPNETSLASHGRVGWIVERTAAHGPRSRQSHWL